MLVRVENRCQEKCYIDTHTHMYAITVSSAAHGRLVCCLIIFAVKICTPSHRIVLLVVFTHVSCIGFSRICGCTVELGTEDRTQGVVPG